MNCRDALRLLFDVIDKEAGEVDSAEVEKHLHKCRHCMAKYEFEQLFRAFVIEKGTNADDTSQIRDKILTKLDAIDAAGEVGAPPRPFKRWSMMALTAAALLVVGVVGAFSLGDYFRTQREFAPFAKAHFAHVIGRSPAGAVTAPLEYLHEHTGIRLHPTGAFDLSSVRSVSVDTIKGIPFGRLELSGLGGSIISVFVTRAGRYDLPAQPIETIGGHRVVVHRCDHCNLIGLSRDDLIFLVVSEGDHQPADLAHLTASL